MLYDIVPYITISYDTKWLRDTIHTCSIMTLHDFSKIFFSSTWHPADPQDKDTSGSMIRTRRFNNLDLFLIWKNNFLKIWNLISWYNRFNKYVIFIFKNKNFCIIIEINILMLILSSEINFEIFWYVSLIHK